MNREELTRLLGAAAAPKEGDAALGVAAADEAERREARRALAACRLDEIAACELVEDRLSERLRARAARDPELGRLTLAETAERVQQAPDPGALGAALTSEQIAALARLLDDDALAAVCARSFHAFEDRASEGRGRGGAVGGPEGFGSRIQPNSPTDDPSEILYSIFEGLSYGCGDVVIGVNPANDQVDRVVALEDLLADVVERLELPTHWCVLSDIASQNQARERGGRVDMGFQSLAGTSAAVRGMIDCDVDELIELCRPFSSLYFETGQGSEFTNGAAAGVDMTTLEARTYGLARLLIEQTGRPAIVNDVAGFIGPEVFRSGEQLLRACLEDLFMGKLHGLPMGLDVCSTYHMGIAPGELDAINARVMAAAPAYLMAVAGKSDPMLGYLTTDARSHPRLRRACGRGVTRAARDRLRRLGVMAADGSMTEAAGDPRPLARAFGESAEGIERTLRRLQDRGLDLGFGCDADFAAPPEVQRRLEEGFAHARRALYREISPATLRAAGGDPLQVRTRSRDRDDYIAHPASGERLDAAGARAVQALARGGDVRLVVSDGLNADAVNENLEPLLGPLRRRLGELGLDPGAEVFVRNGRVRAGYHVGELCDARVLIHLIGERPGTGTNNLSAYVTYGRDAAGASRWSAVEHSHTTALCSINRRVGVDPGAAGAELAMLVDRMLEVGLSGVALAPHLGRR